MNSIMMDAGDNAQPSRLALESVVAKETADEIRAFCGSDVQKGQPIRVMTEILSKEILITREKSRLLEAVQHHRDILIRGTQFGKVPSDYPAVDAPRT